MSTEKEIEDQIHKVLDGKWNMHNKHRMTVRAGLSKEDRKRTGLLLLRVALSRECDFKSEPYANLSDTLQVTFERFDLPIPQ